MFQTEFPVVQRVGYCVTYTSSKREQEAASNATRTST